MKEAAVTTNLQALVDGMVDTAQRTLHDELGTEVSATFTAAQAQWPVKTGTSRASMSMQVVGAGDLRRWVVKVDAWYAAMIRQHGKEPYHTGQRLLREPLKAAASRAAKRVAERLRTGG